MLYKIDLPPIMGKGGKILFDEIELSEKEASVLIEQKIISLKSGEAKASPVSTTQSVEASPEDPSTNPVVDPLPEISSKDAELLEFFNTATAEDLGNLRNIGKTRAEKIKSHAPYTSLADIQAQSGLSNQGWNDAIADLTP